MFLFFSLLFFFDINKTAFQYGLLAILIFLTFSFITASVIAHSYDNIFSRVFYKSSSVWMGVFFYFLLASIFAWCLIFLGKILSLEIDKPLSAIILFSLAFILSAIGLISDLSLKTKNIEVELLNLPENWHGKNIILLSDIHLGLINRIGFAQKIAEKVNSIDHEIVVITGDLFDGQAGDLGCFVGPLDNLKAEKGIFFVTGNHETYLGTEKTYQILSETKIQPLKDEIINVEGLNIIGIGYGEQGEKKNISEAIKSLNGFNKESATILLYHEPVQVAQISESGIDLALSGHTHRGQMWPLNYITKIIYKGYDYGLFDVGSMQLYVTNGTGTWGPPFRTFNRPEITVIKLVGKDQK